MKFLSSIRIICVSLALFTSVTGYSEPTRDAPATSLSGFKLDYQGTSTAWMKTNGGYEIAINEKQEVIYSNSSDIMGRSGALHLYTPSMSQEVKIGEISGRVHALHFSGNQLRIGVSRTNRLLLEVYTVNKEDRTIQLDSSHEIFKRYVDYEEALNVCRSKVATCCTITGIICALPTIGYSWLMSSIVASEFNERANSYFQFETRFTPTGVLYGTALLKTPRSYDSQAFIDRVFFAATEVTKSIFELPTEHEKTRGISFTALSLTSAIAVQYADPITLYQWNENPEKANLVNPRNWSGIQPLHPINETTVFTQFTFPDRPHDRISFGSLHIDGSYKLSSVNFKPNNDVLAFSPDLKFALTRDQLLKTYSFEDMSPLFTSIEIGK